MKAVGITEAGNPDVLQVLNLPEPQAGPGEVRIRVRAAAVNPTDTVLRSGARGSPDGPAVPGMDAAGVVDQVGPEVGERLAVGQEVVALVVPRGAICAYTMPNVGSSASVLNVFTRAKYAKTE